MSLKLTSNNTNFLSLNYLVSKNKVLETKAREFILKCIQEDRTPESIVLLKSIKDEVDNMNNFRQCYDLALTLSLRYTYCNSCFDSKNAIREIFNSLVERAKGSKNKLSDDDLSILYSEISYILYGAPAESDREYDMQDECMNGLYLEISRFFIEYYGMKRAVKNVVRRKFFS